MTKIEIGKPLPLSLQVYDADESLEVTAVLITNTGGEVARVTLASAGAGLYLSDQALMPPCLFCVARYETNSEKYEIVSDVFEAISPEPAKLKVSIGEIVARSKSKLIQGVVKK